MLGRNANPFRRAYGRGQLLPRWSRPSQSKGKNTRASERARGACTTHSAVRVGGSDPSKTVASGDLSQPSALIGPLARRIYETKQPGSLY